MKKKTFSAAIRPLFLTRLSHSDECSKQGRERIPVRKKCDLSEKSSDKYLPYSMIFVWSPAMISHFRHGSDAYFT